MNAELTTPHSYTEIEAAEYLRLRPEHLADERRKGRIWFSRIRRNQVRYTKADLDEYLSTRRCRITPRDAE